MLIVLGRVYFNYL